MWAKPYSQFFRFGFKAKRGSFHDPLPHRNTFDFTQALWSSASFLTGGAAARQVILRDDVPNPANPPSGCCFHTRCPYAVPGSLSALGFICSAGENDIGPVQPVKV